MSQGRSASDARATIWRRNDGANQQVQPALPPQRRASLRATSTSSAPDRSLHNAQLVEELSPELVRYFRVNKHLGGHLLAPPPSQEDNGETTAA